MAMPASLLHDLDWVLPLRQEWLTPVFQGFTFLGFTEFFFAALPLLYWCWNKEAASRVAVLTLISGLFTLFLKVTFADPRPPQEFAMEGYRPESYGLPSGHTLMAITFWGSLAVESGRRVARWVAAVLIAGIAFSRLYLGVHDLEDILVGAVVGVTLLAAYLLRTRCVASLRCRRIALSALFLIPVILIFCWPDSEPMGKMALVSGYYLAWLIGRKIEPIRVRFLPAQHGRRIAAGAAGFVILFLMAYTFRAVLVSAGVPGNAAPFLGGTLIGFAATVLIPWILVKLRILQRSNSCASSGPTVA